MYVVVQNQKSGHRQKLHESDFDKWKPELRKLFVIVDREQVEAPDELKQITAFQKAADPVENSGESTDE